MSIKILLVDDHVILRNGLKTMLHRKSGMEVVGEAGTGNEALKLSMELKPDVVIMDIMMPDMSGVDATRKILGKAPRIKVLALSMVADESLVENMLNAGASGYLLKDCRIEDLVDAINAALCGEPYLSKTITDSVLGRLIGKRGGDGLSAREREVLKLVASGLSTKNIGARMGIGVKTVEKHRRNIGKTLEIHNPADLVKYAIRQGLTGF